MAPWNRAGRWLVLPALVLVAGAAYAVIKPGSEEWTNVMVVKALILDVRKDATAGLDKAETEEAKGQFRHILAACDKMHKDCEDLLTAEDPPVPPGGTTGAGGGK